MIEDKNRVKEGSLNFSKAKEGIVISSRAIQEIYRTKAAGKLLRRAKTDNLCFLYRLISLIWL